MSAFSTKVENADTLENARKTRESGQSMTNCFSFFDNTGEFEALRNTRHNGRSYDRMIV